MCTYKKKSELFYVPRLIYTVEATSDACGNVDLYLNFWRQAILADLKMNFNSLFAGIY